MGRLQLQLLPHRRRFLSKWDADWSTPPDFSNGEGHEITCGVCHDAHQQHEGFQLRAQVTVALPNPAGATIDGWGTGLMCSNCHRERRTPSQIEDHLVNGSEHFGPHPSPEANMVAGIGTYEIPGQDYSGIENQHSVALFPNMCVNCHMKYVEGEGGPSATGHSFEPQLSTCQLCHSGATTFDIGGVQEEVEALMDQLQNDILESNPALAAAGWSEENVGNAELTTETDRTAAWAWFFVEQDGTFGIHNRDYAMTILQNSINYYGVSSKKLENPFFSRK